MGKEGEEVKRVDGMPVPLESMVFDVSWSNEQEGYEIKYTAQEAGSRPTCLAAEGDKRKFIKGSPFAVRVSGVRASAEGSILYGTEEYKQTVDISDGVIEPADPESPAPNATGSTSISPSAIRRKDREVANTVEARITAGDQLQLWPRLHDEFGNASFAVEGELQAFVIQPEGTVDVNVKQLRELGRYELNYEPQKKGAILFTSFSMIKIFASRPSSLTSFLQPLWRLNASCSLQSRVLLCTRSATLLSRRSTGMATGSMWEALRSLRASWVRASQPLRCTTSKTAHTSYRSQEQWPASAAS